MKKIVIELCVCECFYSLPNKTILINEMRCIIKNLIIVLVADIMTSQRNIY